MRQCGHRHAPYAQPNWQWPKVLSPVVSFCCFLMPYCRFTSQGSGLSSFRVATRRTDTIRGYKKASLRVSREAVGIALYETQREANAVAFFLCKVPSYLKLPTFLWTTALQRKLQTGRPLPSAIRLLSCRASFHFSFRVKEVLRP